MTTPDMRWAARDCVTRAKNLLANGDDPSARYACLELRFAIEYLSYDLLQTYRDELPYDAVKKWQPKEVISEMRNVDPHADASSSLSVAMEATPGEPPPDEAWTSLGEEHRFSMPWANKNHNALGNYLHAPTIHHLESGSAATVETIIARATEVLNECEQILNSSFYNSNFGNFFTFNCGDCKTQMRGRVKDPTQKQVVTCRKCHAVYDAEFGEGQKVTLTPHQLSYICAAPCRAENWIGTHLVKEGQRFVCETCGKRTKVVYGMVADDSEASKPSVAE